MVQRLYIFAGKGGVGKTALSLAFTRHLLNHDKKNVVYTFFEQNYASYLCENLNIPRLQIKMMDALGEYVEKKMGSKMVANTILKTPFFKSLFHMLPGLGYVGLLGSLVDRLRKDESLIAVLDPPATGHLLTMFSSLHNFKEVLGVGIFANDIEKIKSFVNSESTCKVTVVSLPTEMALQEAIDLKAELAHYIQGDVDVIVNDSLSCSDELQGKDLPEFMAQKVEQEKKIMQGFDVNMVFPHVFSHSFEEIIEELGSQEWEHLV